GEAGMSSVVDFLAQTGATLQDQCDVGVSRLHALRCASALIQLHRWQDARAAEAERTGALGSALVVLKQNVAMWRQVLAETDAMAFDSGMRSLAASANDELRNFVDRHPSVCEPGEATAILAARDDVVQRQADATAAAGRWTARNRKLPSSADIVHTI